MWDGAGAGRVYTRAQNNPKGSPMRKLWLIGGGVAIIVAATAVTVVSRARSGAATSDKKPERCGQWVGCQPWEKWDDAIQPEERATEFFPAEQPCSPGDGA